MIESRIARRYLWTARKQAHTAFMSSISILGLGVGVFVLLMSIALLSGLQGQIKEKLIASSPQLLIEPAGSNTIADAPAIKVHTLLGFIFGHNKPSLGLFAKFGFETWAKLPKVANLDGIEHDLIILGKRVG